MQQLKNLHCPKCRVLVRTEVTLPYSRHAVPVDQLRLSKCQHEVYVLLCNGMSNEEIAEQLRVSRNTVRYHLKNIYLKLGVRSRTHAAALAPWVDQRTGMVA